MIWYLYNEVGRILLCTMEARGFLRLNRVKREDVAEGAWLCWLRLCALVRGGYSRGGWGVQEVEQNKTTIFQLAAFHYKLQTGTARHRQSRLTLVNKSLKDTKI